MSSSDDPFLRLLASLTGQTIRFRCGSGGLEDALSSYCFLTLCERYGVAVRASSSGAAARFRGTVDISVDAGGGPEIVLPLSGSRAGAVAGLARGDVSVFCCDAEGLRWAELQGVRHDKRWLCRELAFHLDFSDLRFPSEAGEGTVRLAGEGASADDGDALAVILSGAGERWLSRERCRDAVSRALDVLDPYAEVVTDSVDLAILVAKLGRRAVLRVPTGDGRPAATASRFASDQLSVTVDPVPDALARRTAPPRPEDLYGPRERETLLLRIAALEERRDAEVAAAVAAAEADRAGRRLVRASSVERRVDAAEKRASEAVVAERAKAEAAERRAAEIESAAQRRERTVAEAAEKAAAEAADRAAREREVVRAAEENRQQALERRLAEMRDSLDRATAAGVEADRAAAALREEVAATRRRLDAVLRSSSWRVTRPLRGLTRLLRGTNRPAGLRGA